MIDSTKAFIKSQIIAFLNHRFKKDSLKLLLINAHMRSGSSLLVHILNSNPQIIGYGETHCTYNDESDLGKMAFKVYRTFHKYYISEDYVLDKSVHPYDIEDVNVLNDARTIFLIRPPEQTLPSIYKLNPEKYPPQVTYDYYINRIENLKQTALKLDPDKWTLITYNELVKHQEKAFNKIEHLLHLKTKLSGNYDTIWSTGIGGIGDRSDNIYEGKILKDKNRNKPIPEPLEPFIEKAKPTFAKCLNAMENIDYVNGHVKQAV